MAEMPMTATHDYHIRKFEGVLFTIRVIETREYRVRRWLAVKLIEVAARVLGGTVKVETAVE